jgi:hypothetical protein
MKTLVTVALVLLLAIPVLAQDPPKMSAEEQAMMEKWMAAGTPGDPHKLLNDMVGTFSTKITNWSAPGAPPQTHEGVAENRWVMGGRYLEQRFTGSMMEMPFEGVGYTGYDNVTKKYWGTWMDSMSTGVMTSTGSTSDGGKTWAFDATMSDAMTGKEMKLKEKIVVKSADEHIFELWGPDPKGKTFKMMEIVYTRKK